MFHCNINVYSVMKTMKRHSICMMNHEDNEWNFTMHLTCNWFYELYKLRALCTIDILYVVSGTNWSLARCNEYIPTRVLPCINIWTLPMLLLTENFNDYWNWIIQC